MHKKDTTSHDAALKRELAIKRKIGRLSFHVKDNSFQEHLGNFAKRSPEFLPLEMIHLKIREGEIIKKKF